MYSGENVNLHAYVHSVSTVCITSVVISSFYHDYGCKLQYTPPCVMQEVSGTDGVILSSGMRILDGLH